MVAIEAPSLWPNKTPRWNPIAASTRGSTSSASSSMNDSGRGELRPNSIGHNLTRINKHSGACRRRDPVGECAPQADAAESFVQHHDGRRRIRARPDHAVFEPHRAEIEKAVVGKRHGCTLRNSSPPSLGHRQNLHPRCYDAQQRGKALLDGRA
jgi:hypothetical protein